MGLKVRCWSASWSGMQIDDFVCLVRRALYNQKCAPMTAVCVIKEGGQEKKAHSEGRQHRTPATTLWR